MTAGASLPENSGCGDTSGECRDAYRDFRFPRKEKLKGRDEIREVFRRRGSVSCAGAKLFTRGNGLEYNRIAFTFSRKFGNAVERNRSRRLSREAYRHLRNELRKGYDLVVLVYPAGKARPVAHGTDATRRKDSGRDAFSVRLNQLRELFSKAGLWNT